mmetsp:Transcript_8597/g.15601  ORF Transcript_8597/g.15601 Transcript_8597/m.15601 type:complete len:204 (-) Transcript_8597:333-944(-)
MELSLQVRQAVAPRFVRLGDIGYEGGRPRGETSPKAPGGGRHAGGHVGQPAFRALVLHRGRDRARHGRKRSERRPESRHDRRRNGRHVEIAGAVSSVGIVVGIAADAPHAPPAAAHPTSEFLGHARPGLVPEARLTGNVLLVGFSRESFHAVGIGAWLGSPAAGRGRGGDAAHFAFVLGAGCFFDELGWFGSSLRPSLQDLLV